MAALAESNAGKKRGESVLITGIGVMLPGATHVNEFWQDVRDGTSQLGPLTRCTPGRAGVRVAGELRDFDHRKFLPELNEKFANRYTRDALAAMSAVEEARRDAGLVTGEIDPERLSLIASSSRGPLEWVGEALTAEGANAPGPESGAARDRHFGDSGAMLRGMPGAPATLAAIYGDVRGLVTTLSSACVGGHHAIGFAAELIRAGAADAVVVLGHEFPLTPLVFESFTAMGSGVLSTESADPRRAIRPYTREREGFAFGEGAVALCLERAGHAQARGVDGYARVLSHRAVNEATHPFGMDMSGEVTASAVHAALRDAGRGPQDVDWFCGHGTATPKNDVAESRMLGALYPGRPRSAWPPLSSVKPVYGHLLGAAALVNAAATALALHHQCLCATANYAEAEPDPECDHDHVGEGGRPGPVDLAISLAFAIGSQTSVLALGTA
ncbi:type II beta-ketoacyl synthase [Streptomyces lincolnensis]|uniref:Type II beta-ketoacyl synthase n=1 Tax=Streptomyces lincolnensis TaxID=1915 RepID=A0A1B1MJ49_STRLN|nr:beta-ketoacyl synthase N-terminal-like domain-containing protein [Streptomyces lincolnensis]ANS68656.1 type II beta-ketoacyl synthase [Streptomyces lincolnensis]AXG53138.1 type II beta-ketoacyl synthase [Streptomyces lincolnensis]QMV10270.1 beta-ketoacyl-[acyl-carrier-protein] synthase family protein [Streptomyces lincolnensis]